MNTKQQVLTHFMYSESLGQQSNKYYTIFYIRHVFKHQTFLFLSVMILKDAHSIFSFHFQLNHF
jgi:hypothetical protein